MQSVVFLSSEDQEVIQRRKLTTKKEVLLGNPQEKQRTRRTLKNPWSETPLHVDINHFPFSIFANNMFLDDDMD